jgi:hypothetical protein
MAQKVTHWQVEKNNSLKFESLLFWNLYCFIDWGLILLEAVEKAFWQELQTFEKERKVTYVTNTERFGFEQGIRRFIE